MTQFQIKGGRLVCAVLPQTCSYRDDKPTKVHMLRYVYCRLPDKMTMLMYIKFLILFGSYYSLIGLIPHMGA